MKSIYLHFRIWLSLLAALPMVRLGASPFEDANALFKDGKFAEAELAYNRSLAQEGDSPATRYNLGRVREALADPARAMLEWERALRLDPGYKPAQSALTTCRNMVGSKVETARWWIEMQPAFIRGMEPWVAALGAWLAACAAVLVLVSKRRGLSLVLGVPGGILAALGIAWLLHARDEANMALVVDRSAVLRAAPANPARALDSLPAGSRLRLLDTSGGWYSAKAPDGQVGWVPAASVERISP